MRTYMNRRELTGWPSIFLDGIRFIAAATVLVAHSQAIWFPETELNPLPGNLSHGAVVLFFVLSGFVIAHTTSSSSRNGKEYFVARLSRLYSVFLPAIVVTVVCALLIKEFSPDTYEKYQQNHVGFRYIASLFFCNEIWFLSSAPLLNGPIWSLSYEFWYYAIFGAFFYRKPGILGYTIACIVCLIAGPKILLLMFMWLIGWLAYHLPKIVGSKSIAWGSTIGLLLVALLLVVYLPPLPNAVNTTKMHWADKFISDFIVSIIIGVAFCYLPDGQKSNNYSITTKWFRWVADLTFPIYVLHFPILVLSQIFILNTFVNKNYAFYFSLCFTFFLCSIIGIILDKNRKHWKSLFSILVYKPASVFKNIV
ncbi:MAG: acyltransferase [Hymenobacter sp.]|nr:MAG: acyltransferase [Hymenobacter sp.]